jgi:hypothetical protein
MFCVCDLIYLHSVVFYVVTAVHKFDFRLVIYEALYKLLWNKTKNFVYFAESIFISPDIIP